MARNGRHSRGGTPFGSGRSSSPAQHSQRSEFDDQSGSDGDDSPAELYDDDSRAHSGAGTPARGARSDSKSFSQAQFVRRREAKVTIKGIVYKVIDDELMLPDDPRGEAKVDQDGNLSGGRRYKLSTFTSPMRGSTSKRYMLSIDAARAAGFRDSLYFFRRNPLVHKLSCSQVEKDHLIELGKLSTNLKSRAVTMVSARNVYKVMGAAFIKDGKYVIDDYYEDKAIAEGHVSGETAWIETYDPEKDTGTLAANKGLAPLGFQGSGLNTLLGHAGKRPPMNLDPRGGGLQGDLAMIPTGKQFGGAGVQPFGRSVDPTVKKARNAPNLTGQNWMSEYAKNVWDANRMYTEVRKMRMGEVKVGLGVEDREEDLWIETEEFEEDNFGVDDPGSFVAATPLDQLAALFPPSTTTGAEAGSPLPFLPSSRKKRKFYNPILGHHDAETNTPRVLASTQSTSATIDRLAATPKLFWNGAAGDPASEGGVDELERTKRGRIEGAAGKLGIATVEIVVGDDLRAELLPGMWDFGAGRL